jgi:hypothetical protein
MTPSPPTAERIRELGYQPRSVVPGDDPVLVASYGDLTRMAMMRRQRIAIMEHGAGQSYHDHSRHGSYAGGLNRGAASLFLHPGEDPAKRDRKVYPRARVEVVGSPHLDTLPGREGEPGRVVAFTFHFNGSICRETRTAYPEFFPAIAALTSRYEVIGTAHPRMWTQGRMRDRLAARYRTLGIEPVADIREVFRRADLLIFDNTSAGFAFAATGRPVVVLNPPWYDRKVHHGLRFWDAADVGVQCDDPARLRECVEEAFADTPDQQAKRQRAVELVYAHRGDAAQRAADVLLEWAA